MDNRDEKHALALALAEHHRLDPPHTHCSCNRDGEEVVRLGELFSKHLVDVVLAAGWMPADQAGVLFERVRAERDALAATVERVRALCDDPIAYPNTARSGGDWVAAVPADYLRRALDGPGEEDG